MGLVFLRLIVGLTLASHGPAKLSRRFGYGLDATGQMMEGLGFHPGRRFALMAGVTEIGAGLLIASGLFTALGAALAASVMLVAALSVHAKNGFFVSSGGYEFTLVLGGSALSFAFIGPGAWSLDALLGIERSGFAWGLAAVIVAVLGAAVQLAQRRASLQTESATTA